MISPRMIDPPGKGKSGRFLDAHLSAGYNPFALAGLVERWNSQACQDGVDNN
jgi:hypothetical protein